jgi:hypothetical protein
MADTVGTANSASSVKTYNRRWKKLVESTQNKPSSKPAKMAKKAFRPLPPSVEERVKHAVNSFSRGGLPSVVKMWNDGKISATEDLVIGLAVSWNLELLSFVLLLLDEAPMRLLGLALAYAEAHENDPRGQHLLHMVVDNTLCIREKRAEAPKASGLGEREAEIFADIYPGPPPANAVLDGGASTTEKMLRLLRAAYGPYERITTEMHNMSEHPGPRESGFGSFAEAISRSTFQLDEFAYAYAYSTYPQHKKWTAEEKEVVAYMFSEEYTDESEYRDTLNRKLLSVAEEKESLPGRLAVVSLYRRRPNATIAAVVNAGLRVNTQQSPFTYAVARCILAGNIGSGRTVTGLAVMMGPRSLVPVLRSVIQSIPDGESQESVFFSVSWIVTVASELLCVPLTYSYALSEERKNHGTADRTYSLARTSSVLVRSFQGTNEHMIGVVQNAGMPNDPVIGACIHTLITFALAFENILTLVTATQ